MMDANTKFKILTEKVLADEASAKERDELEAMRKSDVKLEDEFREQEASESLVGMGIFGALRKIKDRVSDRILTIWRRFKDKTASVAARTYLNGKYKRYGVMTKLEIDSKNKKISAELELKGELQPITVTVEKFELSNEDGSTFIELKKMTTSREWITVLLEELSTERKFELPSVVKIIL